MCVSASVSGLHDSCAKCNRLLIVLAFGHSGKSDAKNNIQASLV